LLQERKIYMLVPSPVGSGLAVVYILVKGKIIEEPVEGVYRRVMMS
jgi:hypothetical protein